MLHFRKITIVTFTLLLLILAGCATYYQKNEAFFTNLYGYNFVEAKKALESNSKKGNKPRNALLHNLNLGYINWVLGDPTSSNQYFENADKIIEDQQKNYGLEALAMITNPTVKPYRPEDFEPVFVNYYKALNYLQNSQYDEALVECKRINIQLNKLNDKYKDKKNRYQRDAFAHLMMGLIYEAKKDYNNAFIAYRNAFEVYETDYKKNFGVEIPLQLKKDIINTAHKSGFFEDQRMYEDKFNIKYANESADDGELVFLWHNGFGPYKAEWSINFYRGGVNKDGWIVFANSELGLSFPFYIGDKSDNEKNAWWQTNLVRIAFPKYEDRLPYYTSAQISVGNSKYDLELTEDISQIAFKTLNDRMAREIGLAIARFISKKVIESSAKSANEGLGAAVNLVNALSEKADTRNWQTLPHSIFYTKVKLSEGEHDIQLNCKGNNNLKTNNFKVNIQKNRMQFVAFHTIEYIPAQM